MKIAVTYENGQIFQHFGHSEFFKFYSVENGMVTDSSVVSTNGSGHGALAGFLKDNNADILICGGIGGGAQMALAQAGIRLLAGVQGSADDAVKSYLDKTLVYSNEANCSHHDHAHGENGGCGEHSCGSHTCGEGGCSH
ncbi:MAG: NifB/NifX family molybdenum-iron cluster-binding protein [Oscillospiraceae bacterium]|nr:NifB/NifX family molybdenum-iron cluster-binding protein [Oscillospiraceae bacterium]